MKVEIALNLTSNQESNAFLRALWAEFRYSFGKCAWQYSPYKDGKKNRIYFGYVDLGLNGAIGISISYKRKNIIKKIFLEQNFNRIPPEIEAKLSNAIDKAISESRSPRIYYVQTDFESTPMAIGNYSGSHFRLYAIDEKTNRIIYEVKGFDAIDALTEAQKIIPKIFDFLSVCTNSVFTSTSTEIFKNQLNSDIHEVFFEDFDWIDDYPRIEKNLALWEIQRDFLDKILVNDIELNHPFLRSSSHFHSAQKLWLTSSSLVENTIELSSVLYVSALEVATELYPLENSTCKECGQKKYSIRQRVKELTRTHLNEYIERFIDNYYSARSKYLHVGVLSSDSSYIGASIPQLDPASDSGCRIQTSILPINLKEYVSYILRSIFMQKMTTDDRSLPK
ncbi:MULTISPECIES: hypothetical protein [Trichocoleus]|uniref:Apea-like HEPN domain-containing protein n=1 Tax=Trichocoleus desertorum GB2-A4 TaxID=2933944 RepID=A0ABV0JGE6_9CYAN|nr:hypothetical protein [Trichocoleus sp. FACHB-46]MBD1862713.1 hypothetical protein [Trichocoleus sp. FACHB-46]